MKISLRGWKNQEPLSISFEKQLPDVLKPEETYMDPENSESGKKTEEADKKDAAVGCFGIGCLLLFVIVGLPLLGGSIWIYRELSSPEARAKSSAKEILEKKLATRVEYNEVNVVDQKNDRFIIFLDVYGQNVFGANLRKGYLVYVRIEPKNGFDWIWHSKHNGVQECSRPPRNFEIAIFREFFNE